MDGKVRLLFFLQQKHQILCPAWILGIKEIKMLFWTAPWLGSILDSFAVFSIVYAEKQKISTLYYLVRDWWPTVCLCCNGDAHLVVRYWVYIIGLNSSNELDVYIRQLANRQLVRRIRQLRDILKSPRRIWRTKFPSTVSLRKDSVIRLSDILKNSVQYQTRRESTRELFHRLFTLTLLRPVYTGDFCCHLSGNFKRDFAAISKSPV